MVALAKQKQNYPADRDCDLRPTFIQRGMHKASSQPGSSQPGLTHGAV